MKVLHVIPSVSERSGGPGHAIIPMCRALQKQGVEIVLASTNDGNEHAALPNGDYKGVETHLFPVQWGDSFKYSKPLATWLERNIATFDLVHIHAVFNHACVAAARACRKHEVPYIVRPLGTLDPWSMKQKPLKKSLFWQLSARNMMRQAAAIHYTSRGEQESTEGSLGLNHGSVVPLGIDSRPIQVLPSRAEVQSPYVLVLSRLVPTKGLDVLLDAFLQVSARPCYSHWRLIFAGEGPEEFVRQLKEVVLDNDAGNRVIFRGWVEAEAKDQLLRDASLLALPSYHENFGLCVMEALACGVPVLVSPQVNLAAEIETAGAGWIAEIDRDELAKVLAEVFANENERAKRGFAGRELSLRFTWDEVAARLEKLYLSVLHEPKNGVSTVTR